MSRVFEVARPRLLVLVETELWPEMLHQAGLREVPVAVVNARLSPGSFAGYRRVAGRLRTLLAPLAMVLARTEADAQRFAGLNVPSERIVVSGNVKYDLEADQRPLEWEDDIAGSPAIGRSWLPDRPWRARRHRSSTRWLVSVRTVRRRS